MLDKSLMSIFRMQHPGDCSGMYWRHDPRNNNHSTFAGPPEWPRNGSLLRGIVIEIPSAPQGSLKWLQVFEDQQAHSKEWIPTPKCWMQFEQHGLLLHEYKEELKH